jgi:predicted nucleic acid-binding protein
MTDARSGALAYLDANVFIDLVEGPTDVAACAHDLFRLTEGRAGIFVTSELTLAEVLGGPRISALERRLYMNLILWNSAIKLVPVSRSILIETADLRKHSSHKLPDAIHVVTAIREKCPFLISRDKDMKKLPEGFMSRLETGPKAIAALIEALDGR